MSERECLRLEKRFIQKKNMLLDPSGEEQILVQFVR